MSRQTKLAQAAPSTLDLGHKKAKIMLFIYFFLCISASMVHPVTPTLVKDRGFPDFLFGALFSTMSLSSFIFSPLCGYVSDRKGRKMVFCLSLTLYSFAQFLFGQATTVFSALCARALAGFAICGYAVPTLAYMVDVTTPQERGRWLAYYSAFMSIGSALGYFIGGIIGNKSIIISFHAQSISLLVISALVFLFLPESLDHAAMEAAKSDASAKKFYDFSAMGKLLTPTLSLFFVVVALSSFATQGYDNAFNFYIKDVFDFPPAYNGMIKAATGIIGLVANFTINLCIIRRFDLEKSLIALFLACFACLAVVPFMSTMTTFLAACMLFYVFNSIYLPVQQGLMAKAKGANYGLISGLFNSARMFGMFLGPLFMSFVYQRGHNLPFMFAAGGFALSAAITFATLRMGKSS